MSVLLSFSWGVNEGCWVALLGKIPKRGSESFAEALGAGLCLERAGIIHAAPAHGCFPSTVGGHLHALRLLPGQPLAQLIVMVTWKTLRYPRTCFKIMRNRAWRGRKLSWDAQEIRTSALSLGQEMGPSWAMQGEKAGAVPRGQFSLEDGLAGEWGPHVVGFQWCLFFH